MTPGLSSSFFSTGAHFPGFHFTSKGSSTLRYVCGVNSSLQPQTCDLCIILPPPQIAQIFSSRCSFCSCTPARILAFYICAFIPPAFWIYRHLDTIHIKLHLLNDIFLPDAIWILLHPKSILKTKSELFHILIIEFKTLLFNTMSFFVHSLRITYIQDIYDDIPPQRSSSFIKIGGLKRMKKRQHYTGQEKADECVFNRNIVSYFRVLRVTVLLAFSTFLQFVT